MNSRILSLSMAAIALTAGSAAYADIHVDVNPFGWGAPPPVVYESPRYYAPPPVVYGGYNRWGDHSYYHGRDHYYRSHEGHEGHDGDRHERHDR